MSTKKEADAQKPRINLRPILYFALGSAFGIFLYMKIRFGGLRISDFLFLLLIPMLSLRPVSLKRTAAVFLCLAVFAGTGALAIHCYAQNFISGKPQGVYEVTAVVSTFTVKEGCTHATLTRVSLGGDRVSGKMTVRIPREDVRAGDRVAFTGEISRSPLPDDSYGEYLFANDIRYSAEPEEAEITGRSGDPFLKLNAALYDVLHDNMERDEADVAYALLTGNSGGMDEGLLQAVRYGGIAHVFAVSGLHIGILFSAVMIVCKRLGKYRFVPACALSLCYCAVCAFTVSSVRAVIMSSALGLYRAIGRKHDFLNSISFAALLVLTFLPAQFLSAGFLLSFGACLGLALYSVPLSRAFRKFPKFLGNYLSANLSVQLFTFPVLFETFGYFSVWGTLLNFVLIPLMPVLFLGVLSCGLLALIVSPAAAFLLSFPGGMLSLLLFVFSAADFSFVLTGFSLGAGGTVWLVASVLLSEKVRFSWKPRAVLAAGLAVLFALCVFVRNAVVCGCKFTVEEYGRAVLVQTGGERVLILNGASLVSCERFLNRNYGGTLSAVVVAGEDEFAEIGIAAFLPAEEIYAREEIFTGLQETEVKFAEEFTVGELGFRFESATKLAVFYGELVAEIDLNFSAALGADLFIGADSFGCTYYLNGGNVYKLLWE